MAQQPNALRLADSWDSAISTRRHVAIGCEIAEELRRLHAENEALKANHKIVGYTTKPITWNSERHHSEQIMKITQRAQPEHGFVHPVYAVCNSVEHDHA